MFDEIKFRELNKKLQVLGLEEKSAAVYMSLLRLGDVGSSKIIKNTGLHGQYVYQSLEKLEKMGLAQHIIKRGHKKFSAKSPSVLVRVAEEHKIQAESLAGELNKFRNKMVGFVFQFYHLLDELTVLENVFLPAMTGRSIIGWLACRRQAKNRAKELLAQLGLAERTKHKPYQLSGGERQRVAIGRALMNEPRLLLADEPTGNLDSATGNGILEVLEKLNRVGQTIVMVTHDERIAQRAGRIVTLVDGKIEHKNKNP